MVGITGEGKTEAKTVAGDIKTPLRWPISVRNKIKTRLFEDSAHQATLSPPGGALLGALCIYYPLISI